MKKNGDFLFIYKNKRKNAKCELISINELINKDNNNISDDRILEQFTRIIDLIVSKSINYNKFLELSGAIYLNKNSSFISVNNEKCDYMETINFYNDRKNFNSLENCINYIYGLFFLIYPYNKLSLSTIYENHSIKYIINKYYNN